jgi:predicted nucleic-acid-binding Zn-ribbon protein
MESIPIQSTATGLQTNANAGISNKCRCRNFKQMQIVHSHSLVVAIIVKLNSYLLI